MTRKVKKNDIKRHKVLEYLGGNKARFECGDGHQYTAKVVPPAPGGREASEWVAKFMAERWMRSGVTACCPKCQKSIRSLESQVTRLEMKVNRLRQDR